MHAFSGFMKNHGIVQRRKPWSKELLYLESKATCKNCRKAEAIIEEIITGHEELFDYRKLTLDSQEAQDLGVLCTPSVTLNGQIIVLGELPDRRL